MPRSPAAGEEAAPRLLPGISLVQRCLLGLRLAAVSCCDCSALCTGGQRVTDGPRSVDAILLFALKSG